MKGKVGTFDIDMDWEDCKGCLHLDFKNDRCRLGIDDERSPYIEIDEFEGTMRCNRFVVGDPEKAEELLEELDRKIKNGEIIIDSKRQGFLFEGVKPIRKVDLVSSIIQSVAMNEEDWDEE